VLVPSKNLPDTSPELVSQNGNTDAARGHNSYTRGLLIFGPKDRKHKKTSVPGTAASFHLPELRPASHPGRAQEAIASRLH
jgi:hypothetical protein